MIRFNDLYFNRSIKVDESAYEKSNLFKGLERSDLDDVFNGGYLFFYHNFGIQTGFFKKNKDMEEAFHLVGTTNKEKLSDSFVSCIEHKKYPVMANQWHPEKNANEKGYKYKFLDKSRRTIKFLNTFTKKLLDSIRTKAKPLTELPPIVESFVSWSFDPVQTNYTGNNRIFIVPRIYEDHEL